jgi:hypothetical protein
MRSEERFGCSPNIIAIDDCNLTVRLEDHLSGRSCTKGSRGAPIFYRNTFYRAEEWMASPRLRLFTPHLG